MNILQEIFSDHYEEMVYTLHPRDAVIENVKKMIHCGDPAYGGAMYGCPKCGKLKSSEECLKECVTNKNGENAGKRGLWYNGNRINKETGVKTEYCFERFEKYLCTDFSRFH